MKHCLVLLALLVTSARSRHLISSGTCVTSAGSGDIIRVSLSNCVKGEARARVRAGRQGFLGDTNTPVISYSPDNEVTTALTMCEVMTLSCDQEGALIAEKIAALFKSGVEKSKQTSPVFPTINAVNMNLRQQPQTQTNRLTQVKI